MANPPSYSEDYLRQTQQPVIYGICSALIVIETLAVALRFVSKVVGRLRWGVDDLFIALGLLINLAIVTCAIGKQDPSPALFVFLRLISS